jgi:nucleoside-diphosphate-sugar epimerase
MNIFITGHSGFVGKYFIDQNLNKFKFNLFRSSLEINSDVVLHIAGKAHDLKKTANPNEYYKVNTELTKSVFDAFLISSAKVFITFSSVKAVADVLNSKLTEDFDPYPSTHYGKSKLLAEKYILSKVIPDEKRVYILRPCMIHGPGNKGNLNLLYNIVSKGLPWPLGAFENKRSFCSIDNLCFIINELIENENIPPGIYNICDDVPLSTNELISLISISQGKDTQIWKIPKSIIKIISKIGDFLWLPLNTEKLSKLTETYVVSNNKIKLAINKSLPLSSIEGLKKSFNSFNTNAQ